MGGLVVVVAAAVVGAADVAPVVVAPVVVIWPVVKVKDARQTRMIPKTFILSSFAF